MEPDIDPQAIAWCRRSLPFAAFSTNNSRPPLGFPDQSFDLVTAISVFTHLDNSNGWKNCDGFYGPAAS